MFKKILLASLFLGILGIGIYYFYPIQKISQGIVIDKIVVSKSEHKMFAYSKGNLVVTYKVAIGKNKGDKEFEGDQKTPEGNYTINDKNPNSGYHLNLGISYPNDEDRAKAKSLGKPVGGSIKIHGLNNGKGYIGKFQRWKDWTNGCIALTNEELDEIYNHTPIGTPIEIRK